MVQIKKPKTKILSFEHSGQLRPHHHTSYGSLFFILILATIPTIILGHVYAATSGGGGYQVYAVVPAVVSKVPPVITSPKSGQTYSSADLITVQGTCPPDTLVKIFNNEVMAGDVLCSKGSFDLNMELFEGANSLIARAYNANDIPGPDSVPVGVNLLLPGSSLLASTANPNVPPANQFYLTSDVYYRGANAGATMTWPLTLSGGTAPYAVSVEWGDGKSDLISRVAPGTFDLTHVYSKAATYSGSYTVTIKASDQQGDQSYLQLAAIVHNQNGLPVTSTTTTNTSTNSQHTAVEVSLQLVGLLTIIVTTFWLGEKRQLFINKGHRLSGTV